MRHWAFIFMLFISCDSSQKIASNVSDSEPKIPFVENTMAFRDNAKAPFYHGVASGDPDSESVVLWTRVTPEYQQDKIQILCELSETPEFNKIIQAHRINTSASRDYTAKLLVNDLDPGKNYFYRFKAFEKYSPVGKTSTLGKKDVKIAVASCSNIEFGYFNAYAAMARENFDLILHLGDYIYEYEADKYGDEEFVRKSIPENEIISLQDYRDRYNQYKLDQDLQAAHASAAFVNIWDDHEITNNAYVSGGQNHQSHEGDYSTRKEIARQVFYEWLPIRDQNFHYRKLDGGDLIDIILLDERLAGRTMQADSIGDPKRFAEDHTILGKEQLEWVEKTIRNSDATWKLIGNQVIFSYCDWSLPGFNFNMDAWDGYPSDQEKFSEILKATDNAIIVTGDTHRAWAFEATHKPFPENNEYDPVALEFGVTSITSGNSDERFPVPLILMHEKLISGPEVNPHLKYVNTRDHGYLSLSINKERLIAHFRKVEDLSSRSNKATTDKSFMVKANEKRLHPSQ